MTEGAKAVAGLIASLQRLSRNVQLILSVLALVIGVAAGGAAIGFRRVIDLVQRLGFGFGGERVASGAAELPWWQLLAVPTLGGLAIGLFVYFLMPERRPHAVADVIEANALRGGRMSLFTGLKAALVSATSIGCGASVGREGPVVHLGASLGAWTAQRLHLARAPSRTLLGCGVAAAVAASFNAPIAGTFFALEVVIGHYALTAFTPVVIAAVIGTIVSRMYYGDYPAFILPETLSIVSFWEFPAFALLGAVSAVAAIIFMRSILFVENAVGRTPLPAWGRPAAAGLLVGCMALVFPQVLGVGYEATDAALSDLYPLWLLIALIVAKTAATAISLGCGFGGGVFSPSLVIGALIGGAYGIIATSAFPELSSGHGAYTIIGMGAVAGAVLGAPISTILMVFELTNDYAITIGVMIATSIASIVTQQVEGHSFFTWQLARRGISVKGGRDISTLRNICVRDVMSDDYRAISPEAPITSVRVNLQGAPWGELFVVDDDGRLSGVITFADLHEAAFDTSHDSELTAADVLRRRPPVLEADDDLETATRAYESSGEANLAVVESRESRRLVGVAQEHSVVLAYHRALDQARAEERGEV
jgi:CIC family chloride channel protein